MRTYHRLLICVFTVSTVVPLSANATKCESRTVREAYDAATTVIAGKIISNKIVGNAHGREAREVQILVKESWKSPDSKFSDIVTFSELAYNQTESRFNLLKDYVVYLQRDSSGKLVLDACGSFEPLSSTYQNIRTLDEIKAPSKVSSYFWHGSSSVGSGYSSSRNQDWTYTCISHQAYVENIDECFK